MATMPLIADLDRCKIALQCVAEMQSDSLTAVLDILLERLDDAIGQVHAQLRQCTCQAPSPRHAAAVPAPPGVLTVVPKRRQTPRRPTPGVPEDRPAGEALQDPLEPGA
jgi:hypothetical protein